jgi:hypothetical protein
MALNVADIIEFLPQLLFMAQIAIYLLLSWFFGSIAFRGVKKKMHFAVRIAARLGTGFLCLVSGAALRNYLFFFNGTIFQIMQIDFLIGGLIAAAVLAIAFYLITRKYADEDSKKVIRRLQGKIKLLEDIINKHKIPALNEHEAMRVAESVVPGFSARHAVRKDADWEITLERDKKGALVVLGAYTGEVKRIEHAGRFQDSYMIAGVVIIAVFFAFSLLSFRSIPSISDGVASLLGMDPGQFNSLIGTNTPEGCVSPVKIMMSKGVSVVRSENIYQDENVKNMIESASGRRVMMMYKTDFEGKEYIISITVPYGMATSNTSALNNEEVLNNSEICVSTLEKLCGCIKIPDVNNSPFSGMIVGGKN